MNRIDQKHNVFMDIAKCLAKLSTCQRRAVGCVLVNDYNRIIGTGYNGVATSHQHCRDGMTCPGAFAESGEQMDKCYAIHAETNAITQTFGRPIHVAYVTTFPCVHCIKHLLTTQCQLIVYSDNYSNGGYDLWQQSNRRILQL